MYATDPAKLQPLSEFTPGNETAVAALQADFEKRLGKAAVCSPAMVEQLVDAAFRELQHDTGPQDPEYVHQRRNLVNAFARILRVRKNRRRARSEPEPL